MKGRPVARVPVYSGPYIYRHDPGIAKPRASLCLFENGATKGFRVGLKLDRYLPATTGIFGE